MNTVLSQAADLLEQPSAWIQGKLCASKEGSELAYATDGKACSWCAIGAIDKVSKGEYFSETEARRVLRKHLAESTGKLVTIAAWNDNPARTQAEVVAALREAATK